MMPLVSPVAGQQAQVQAQAQVGPLGKGWGSSRVRWEQDGGTGGTTGAQVWRVAASAGRDLPELAFQAHISQLGAGVPSCLLSLVTY